MAIFNATGGPDWGGGRGPGGHGWGSGDPCSGWAGVCCASNATEWGCSGAPVGQVAGLNLGFNGLSGTLPPDPTVWGALPLLRSLSMRSNALSGTLPPALRLLTSLEDLNLRRNRISGTLPAALGPLQRLKHFSLFTNRVSGTVPATFGGLTELGEGPHGGLDMTHNRLRGRIPAELSALRHFHAIPWSSGGNIGLGGDGDGNVFTCPVPPITLTNGTVTTTYAHCSHEPAPPSSSSPANSSKRHKTDDGAAKPAGSGGAYLTLAALHNTAAALSGPAHLLLLESIHRRAFDAAPPSALFAAAMTARSVGSILVAPLLCSLLDRVSQRLGLLCCIAADVACHGSLIRASPPMSRHGNDSPITDLVACLAAVLSTSDAALLIGSSLCFWPVVAVEALTGCCSGTAGTALDIMKYAVAGGQPEVAAQLSVKNSASEAVGALLAASSLSVFDLSASHAMGLAVAVEAALLCVILGAPSVTARAATTTTSPTPSADGPKPVVGWGAFVTLWRDCPLERVHLIHAIFCIGAGGQLQRKMQFGAGGTTAHLAWMTCIGKLTYIAVAVFDLCPKAKRALSVRTILASEPAGHSAALFMAVGPHANVPLLYAADLVKWGSLAVGDPVEEAYRVTAVQKAGLGVGTHRAITRLWGSVCGLYKPALETALWAWHLDAPLLYSGTQFALSALQIWWVVGRIESAKLKEKKAE